MTNEQFIVKHVQAELTKLGFSLSTVLYATDKAKKYYRECHQASAKGKMFDDCLNEAKSWAKKIQPKKR